jgi:hypothetical protein
MAVKQAMAALLASIAVCSSVERKLNFDSIFSFVLSFPQRLVSGLEYRLE